MISRSTSTRRGLLPAILVTLGLASGSALAEDCTIKIGAAGPMSGGAALFGLGGKAAADLQAGLANEAGGLQVGNKKCKVTVVSFDSQYTPAGGAAAANYFAAEGIHVVVGPIGSPETAGFRPVGKRTGQVHIVPSYAADVIGPDWPYTFHALLTPLGFGPPAIKAAKEKFGFTSVAFFATNDSGGADAGAQFEKLYTAAGVKFIPEYYQRGTTNFAPIVARIMNENPGAVEVSPAPPADATTFVRQLLEAGYTGAIGSLGGGGSAPIINGAGGADKVKAAYWLELLPVGDPGITKMKEEYQRLFKSDPPNTPLFPIMEVAAEQLIRGIVLAGTADDADKIADAMKKMTPESRYMGKGGWRGKAQFGVNQELAFPFGLGFIENGKRLPVQRVEVATE